MKKRTSNIERRTSNVECGAASRGVLNRSLRYGRDEKKERKKEMKNRGQMTVYSERKTKDRGRKTEGAKWIKLSFGKYTIVDAEDYSWLSVITEHRNAMGGNLNPNYEPLTTKKPRAAAPQLKTKN